MFPSHVFVFVFSLILSPGWKVFVFMVGLVYSPSLLALVFACFHCEGFRQILILVGGMGFRIVRILLSHQSCSRPFLSRVLDRILILLVVFLCSYIM